MTQTILLIVFGLIAFSLGWGLNNVLRKDWLYEKKHRK